MATELRIPKLDMSMTEGKLVEWLATDGSTVKEGDVIYSLESDKTVNEIEAPVSGVLRIGATTDETYEVGALIGEIE
jgi:pyruvate/2-oxoglutarate dehydrogenase complex dihydrolipoamide acyltransferase (E2) component